MPYHNTYLFADIPIGITSETSYLHTLCKDYVTDEPPRYSLTVTREDAEKERSLLSPHFHQGYLESLAAYRKISEAILCDDIILFHSSAIMVDGKAYLFTAPSGTGKSTHARLWREMLGNAAVMINDDKPLIRIQNGIATVYGTPYDGKEHLSTKTHAPIAGICILSQAKENSIRRITPSEALPTLLSQTYRPQKRELMQRLMPLVVALSAAVPVFHMGCNISAEASALSYQTMKEATK
ncbi:MAG: hypothetical protein IJV98_06425 [Clostridia bacterium]|nr:hypothetical protein [Clostridia bacterium]